MRIGIIFDEKYVYANVDGLLGFEIAEIQKSPWGGRMIARVEAHTSRSTSWGESPFARDTDKPAMRRERSSPGGCSCR